MSLKCLYKNVTPWDCVRELVKNSIQAEASNIAVRVDLHKSNLRIQVIDDGVGIKPEDMLVIGKQSWSSKESSSGNSLANLRRVTKRLTILSKNIDGDTILVKFEEGKRKITNHVKETRRCHGSTVTVDGFLWNLRIRRKVVREVSSLCQIKRGLLCLAFLNPSVKYSLRNDTNGARDLVVSTDRGNCAAEVFVKTLVGSETGLNLTPKEFILECQDTSTRIFGLICSESYHNRSLQFVCVNGQPLLKYDALKHINQVVIKYSFPQSTENVTKQAIFVLIFENVDPEKIGSVLELCLNNNGRNTVQSSSWTKLNACEIIDGINPLGSSSGFMDLGKNETPLNHLTFTPYKSSGMISRHINLSVEDNIISYDLSQAEENLAFFLGNWNNPQFECFIGNTALFPLMSVKYAMAGTKSISRIKLTKSDVETQTAVRQVDDKYLVSVCHTRSLLLLWDQHAVHERINLEFLLNEWNTSCPAPAPISIQLSSAEDVSVLVSTSSLCAKYGIGFSATEDKQTVIVTDIPKALKHLPLELLDDICTRIFQEIVELNFEDESYPLVPTPVHKFLATQACRGSIMFGQTLELETCRQLLGDLARCGAPFQCAHGRPSVHVLCNVNIGRMHRTTGNKKTRLNLWKLKAGLQTVGTSCEVSNIS